MIEVEVHFPTYVCRFMCDLSIGTVRALSCGEPGNFDIKDASGQWRFFHWDRITHISVREVTPPV